MHLKQRVVSSRLSVPRPTDLVINLDTNNITKRKERILTGRVLCLPFHADRSRFSRPRERRCKNCQIHLSRDVHVDITSVKRRFSLEEDITKHTYTVDFVDRSSSDVRTTIALYRSNQYCARYDFQLYFVMSSVV